MALAGVGSPNLLASAIAAALGVSLRGPAEPHLQLVRYLSSKNLLLVLDSFEHLLDGAGLLTDILSGASGVRILVTSRERLNLQEEWVLMIEGLPFPDRIATESIDQYPAVQLFIQRALQVQADFSLTDNAQPVIDICRRVEGMPLALELAATWLRVMPCDRIASRIERSLDFLTTSARNVPDRHRSLRAVLDRSWSLLSKAEQLVLASLSVFRGGLDVDAAEQVAGASLALLASLVDKSLLRATAGGRYDLHELVRQYLSEKLDESGDTLAVARLHFDFYLRLANLAEGQLYGPDQEAWFDRLELESDNLAAALAWSVREEELEAGLRLAAALGSFWEHRGHFHDAREWFERLLAVNGDVNTSVRAKALRTAGVFAIFVRDPATATALCEESLRLAHNAGDQWNVAWCLASLGFFEQQTWSDPARAVEQLEEALRLFRALGDGWGISHALRRLGWMLTAQGNYKRAATLLEEALTLARQAHNKHATAWALFLLGNAIWLENQNAERATPLYRESLSLVSETRDRHNLEHVLLALGQVARARGDYAEAQSRYDEVVVLLQEQGGIDYLTWDVSALVCGFAQLALATGKPEEAARLFGAAHVVLSKAYLMWGDRHALDRDIAAARRQLGEAVFSAEFAAGQGMSMEHAVAYALQGRTLKTG